MAVRREAGKSHLLGAARLTWLRQTGCLELSARVTGTPRPPRFAALVGIVLKLSIEINDLRRHSEALRPELRGAFDRVVESGWYVLGEECRLFEREFATFCGVAECVGVANGTDAIEIALRAIGVAKGTRVATVANAGFYSSIALRNLCAEPVFVDVEPRTYLMSFLFAEPHRRGGGGRCYRYPSFRAPSRYGGRLGYNRPAWHPCSRGLCSGPWGDAERKAGRQLRRSRDFQFLPYQESWRYWGRRRCCHEQCRGRGRLATAPPIWVGDEVSCGDRGRTQQSAG